MSFEVSEPAQPNRINIRQIQDKSFSTAWKGYRIDDVRAYLAQVAFEVRELSMELDAARARIQEIGENDGQSGEALSKEVLRAEETAAQILHDANEAAKALRDQARQHFETVRQKAEEEAREVLDNARAQSRRDNSPSDGFSSAQIDDSSRKELEQARSKAAEIIERSKAEGRAMIDQARDLRNEILADLRQKRAVLDSEIADLATRRIEAYQSLTRAVQLISEAGTIVFSGEHEEQQEQEESGEIELSADGPEADQSTQYPFKEPSEITADSESEKPKSALSEGDRYQAAVISSQVEIGDHLEEGIVRVFHKDTEISASGKEQALDEVSSAGESESSTLNQHAGVILENSGEEGLRFEADAGDSAKVSWDQVSSRATSEEVVIGEDNRSSVMEISGLESDQVPASGSHDDEMANAAAAIRETSETAEVGQKPYEDIRQDELEVLAPAQRVEPGSLLNSVGDEAQRSRKADEILARIRSLRVGERASDSSIHGDTESLDLPAETEPISAHSHKEPRVPKIFSLSDTEAEDRNKGGESNAEIEEGDYGGVGAEGVSPEIDAATRELLDVREELLAPVAAMLFKRMKRLLSDEQNDLLDKVRRGSGSEVELEKLLVEKEQIDALAFASLDFFEQVRLGVAGLFVETNGSSVRRDISKQAVQYSEEFAKEVILPLRRRIGEALSVDVTAEDQSTAGALGAIYRDVRSNRLEPLISQYANTVFCATVMLESGYESFVWATDPREVPCADCLDNSLAGITMGGEQFPTGHYHPGIHSGCSCLLVPFIA